MMLNKRRQSYRDTLNVPIVIKFTDIKKNSSFIVFWKGISEELLFNEWKVSSMKGKRDLVICKES